MLLAQHVTCKNGIGVVVGQGMQGREGRVKKWNVYGANESRIKNVAHISAVHTTRHPTPWLDLQAGTVSCSEPYEDYKSIQDQRTAGHCGKHKCILSSSENLKEEEKTVVAYTSALHVGVLLLFVRS